ncbi:unnamed protein product [Meganyctiphanes norvegica]|uniref:BTB domain-containing protein n=1 Tax=Meganyctiphanes norvegica TaxID=48144 RepID=A0AAV2QLP9_MEGNR
MDVELLSLKWNNQYTTFYQAISGLRNGDSYTDVTLACDGKYYPVHKLVLAMCSEYFNDIFQITYCKNPVVILKDIQSSDLEYILDYMYIGEVNVRQNELSSLMEAAKCLRVKGLVVPDEDPKEILSSGRQQILKPQSPPSKRRKTGEPINIDSNLNRRDMCTGSNLSLDVIPSNRSEEVLPHIVHGSYNDDPVQQMKLEKDYGDLDITIKSNCFNDGGDGSDTVFVQSNIEKEESISMSDPSEFAGPSDIQNIEISPFEEKESELTKNLSCALESMETPAQQSNLQQPQLQVSTFDDGSDKSTLTSPIRAPESCHIISSYKATLKLKVGQHLFLKEREVRGKFYWRCEDPTCGARVHTISGEIVKHNPVHTHPAVPGKAEVEEILGAMKEHANTTKEPINNIVSTVYAQLKPDWVHLLPPVDSMKRVLRRVRQAKKEDHGSHT